jgi:hypothetical protein
MRKNPATNRDDGELVERGLRELTKHETGLIGGGSSATFIDTGWAAFLGGVDLQNRNPNGTVRGLLPPFDGSLRY